MAVLVGGVVRRMFRSLNIIKHQKNYLSLKGEVNSFSWLKAHDGRY